VCVSFITCAESMIRRRKKAEEERDDDNVNDVESGSNVGGKKKNLRASKRGRSKKPARISLLGWNISAILLPVLPLLLILLLLLLSLHEYHYSETLHRIDIPTLYLARPSDITVATTAVVSMHRGVKFVGSLGGWLRSTKQAYAARHSYAYYDAMPSAEVDLMVPLSDTWHQERIIYFDKLRVLLFVLERYPNLRYVLWLDGDAVVTEPKRSVEETVKRLVVVNNNKNDLCMIWAKDAMGPNAGVFVLQNTPTTRELLKASLSFIPQDEKFADQAALIETIHSNQTYQDCAVLLGDDDTNKKNDAASASFSSSSTMLQSRVRGPRKFLYHDGDWILHLPNHNRWELLQSLSKWVRHKQQTQQTNCKQAIQPLGPPNLSTLSSTRRERYQAVRDAIRHAWNGYANIVLPSSPDDLNPVTGQPVEDWLHHAATLHDALDTLYLANLTDEYRHAVSLATATTTTTAGSSRDNNIQTTAFLRPTKTFEYSLRIVGGLLGAYGVSGDQGLLRAAVRASDALLAGPFGWSPTALPRPFDLLAPQYSTTVFGGDGVFRVSMYRITSFFYRWGRDMFTSEHRFNSLAGVGSFALEFNFLSQVTGDFRYQSASNAIYQVLERHAQPDGMFPNRWNVMTGEPPPVNSMGLASGGDSFYEYLLKAPLWKGCTTTTTTADSNTDYDNYCNPIDRSMLHHYQTLVRHFSLAETNKHVKKENQSGHWLPVDGSRFHHLLCFLPGLLALGDDGTGNGSSTMIVAKELVLGCHSTYTRTATGLGPEQASVHDGRYDVKKWGYYLRPEHVESLFVLYRKTGDPIYQDMAWDIFESIERHCKTTFGYQGLANVDQRENGTAVPHMPSYFLAETLKYLLLLFGPDDYVSLDDFVFTTEAHPLRRGIPQGICSMNEDGGAHSFWSAAVMVFQLLLFLVIVRQYPRRYHGTHVATL
jgi:mannosyl-oligosaccharide alpha-1,2-mannosidase